MDEREKLRAAQIDNLQKLAVSEAKLAEKRGEAAGLITATLAADEALHEMLRAQAWVREDATLQINYNAGAAKFTGVPDGWPDSIEDPTEHVAARLNDIKNQRLEAMFGAKPDVVERQVEDSPSVRRLAAMLEQGA